MKIETAAGGLQLCTWDYRVIRHTDSSDETTLLIHRVFYRVDGSVHSWSEDGSAAIGATIGILIVDLDRMHKACDLPILEILHDGQRKYLAEVATGIAHRGTPISNLAREKIMEIGMLNDCIEEAFAGLKINEPFQ